MEASRTVSTTTTTQISNQNKKELLCIHGPGHLRSTPGCRMAHSIAQWEPKYCRFSIQNCRSGMNCIFWHQKSESLEEFLKRSIVNEKSFFFKNKRLYQKNYPIR